MSSFDHMFGASYVSEYDEIVQLSKNGQYNEAYEKAKNVMANNPECLWVYNQLGWCIRARMKNAASLKQEEVFLVSLQELADINNEHSIDPRIIKAVVWPIREFVAKCVSPTLEHNLLYRVFAIMQQIPFDPDDENYHILLQPFLKAKGWGGLESVIKWWGLEHLTPSDYIPYENDNGQKIMSFGEQVLIAYSRILLKALEEKRIRPEDARPHVMRLEDAANTYTELQYPKYFQAQLMLAMGDKEGVVDILLPFVRKKRNDYWVWEALGDAVSDNDMRLAYYCKALSCHIKDSFLRKLYFKTCDAFMAKERWEVAKAMLRKGLEISNANNWKIPYKYQNYTQEDWYLQASDIKLDGKFYANYVSMAESVLFSDKPLIVVVITYVNKDKQVIHFLTENREEGFVRYGHNLKNPHEGMLLSCRMEKIDDRWKLYSVSQERNMSLYEGTLIRNVEGTLKKTTTGIGFVERIFVPAKMVAEFQDGQTLHCIAIPNFNKAKGEWGWRAICVTSNVEK